MGNRPGRLFKKRDTDRDTFEAVPPPTQTWSSTTPHKNEPLNIQSNTNTVIIGDLTIFSRKNLGNGYFGAVFEGQWCQKPCAVKVLNPLGQEFLTGLPITQQNNVQEEALLKFKQECDFMKSYEHPNIVTYYSTVFYPGCNLPVLVMELMQTSLRKYINKGAVMSTRTQVSLSCDIASALEFLHDRGLVHRDLCGDNILLNYYDQDIPVAKVSDFGISRVVVKPEQLSHSLTALGHRPGYLPPEASSVDPTDYDSSLDIFMFGVVMTQIASNVPTVDSCHQRQQLVSQLDQQSLDPFIFQCLSENRKDRPSASTLYLGLLSQLKALRLKEEHPTIATLCGNIPSHCDDFNLRLWEDKLHSSINEPREKKISIDEAASMEVDRKDKLVLDLADHTDYKEDSEICTHDSVEVDVRKKPIEIEDDDDDDDDEPPPPYSENDPVTVEDDKSDIEGDNLLGTQHTTATRNCGGNCMNGATNEGHLVRDDTTIVDYHGLQHPNVNDSFGLEVQTSKTDIAQSHFHPSENETGRSRTSLQVQRSLANMSRASSSKRERTLSELSLNKGYFNEDGHLLDIWLKKGQLGGLELSMSTVANTTSEALQRIGMQQEEENREIKWGDMILKVNDTCVLGISQMQVQELLASATLNVKFTLLRQDTTGRGEEACNRKDGAKQEHITTESGISLKGLPQVQVWGERKGAGSTSWETIAKVNTKNDTKDNIMSDREVLRKKKQDWEPLSYTSFTGAQSNCRVLVHQSDSYQYRGGIYGTDSDIDMPVPSDEEVVNRK